MGLQDVEILFPILPFLPRDDVNLFPYLFPFYWLIGL